MDDEMILDLYWDRKESAITETAKKYGGYCQTIAHNILNNWADEEECVNDTWLHAWNAIPPHRPSPLAAFLGKITRNLSLDLYRKKHREKRGGDGVDLVLDELAELVSGKDDPEGSISEKELKKDINEFLATQPRDRRYMFILRYWYAYSISEIAERFSMRENTVSVNLSRLRSSLKAYLVERGYEI